MLTIICYVLWLNRNAFTYDAEKRTRVNLLRKVTALLREYYLLDKFGYDSTFLNLHVKQFLPDDNLIRRQLSTQTFSWTKLGAGQFKLNVNGHLWEIQVLWDAEVFFKIIMAISYLALQDILVKAQI
ncbi:hypothetical protein ACH5RR_029665 [Cinchona calisaya]|uniref:Uncharacterized protein n=1 Tax=Cinchona calisaya TaxID=153742 RepID=A0ABD2YVL0_9GENT